MTAKKRTHASPHVHVLAMGAGVQTTTLFMMGLYGNYRKPDAVIFADLGWEPPAVYRNVAWLKHQAHLHDIPFYTIKTTPIRQAALDSPLFNPADKSARWASMPLFSLNSHGERGMLRRQCTTDYKIRPIDTFIRQEILGLAKHAKCPARSVYLWFGITTDEHKRARIAIEPWKMNTYPLLELQMSRHDCQVWLDQHNIHHPAKSSCTGCPYRTNVEWAWMLKHNPTAFAEACAFDEAIRHPRGLNTKLFLHQSRVPLDTVDFSDPGNETSNTPWQTECLGYCGT